MINSIVPNLYISTKNKYNLNEVLNEGIAMVNSYVLPNRIIRLKRQNRMIPAEATFNRVWEQIELLKSKSSVKMFLNRSISNNFEVLDIELIKTGRKNFNIKKGIPERFIKIDEVEETSKNAVISIKQAHEYFKSANKASPMTKPLLLYYGMVSFAKALINSTYYIKENNKVRGHGLFVSDNDKFTVKIENKKVGEYQSFRDCYIGDTIIYARDNPLKVNLKDLLAVVPGMGMEWKLAYKKEFDERYYNLEDIPPEHDKYFSVPSYGPLKGVMKTSKEDFNIIYGMGDTGEIHNPECVVDIGIHGSNFGKAGRDFIYYKNFAHIIDVYYLAMFILCFYARYRPVEWNKFLKENNNLFLIQTFLRRAELDFPMLIYSEITGIKTYFKTFA